MSTPVEPIVMPIHHERYARAWSLHRDPDMSDESRQILEREMDDSQNHFTWDEFQEFKETLPGFVDHWAGLKDELMSKLEDRYSA